MRSISNSDARLVKEVLARYGAEVAPADSLRDVNLRRRARLLLKKLERNDRN